MSSDYHNSVPISSQGRVLVEYYETIHVVWSMVKLKGLSMWCRLGCDDNPRHIEGVYSTLSLRHIESSKFNNLSLERSNGRCPGVWLHQSRGDLVSSYCTFMGALCLFTEVSLRRRISYRRGLWRCLFDYNRQCESLSVWDGQQDDSRFFCVCVSNQVFDKIPSRYGKILRHVRCKMHGRR